MTPGRLMWPPEPADLLQWDATVGQQGHEAVAELPGRPLVGVDPVDLLERLAGGAADIGRVERLAQISRKRSAGPAAGPATS
jgi:hypothetical protein